MEWNNVDTGSKGNTGMVQAEWVSRKDDSLCFFHPRRSEPESVSSARRQGYQGWTLFTLMAMISMAARAGEQSSCGDLPLREKLYLAAKTHGWAIMPVRLEVSIETSGKEASRQKHVVYPDHRSTIQGHQPRHPRPPNHSRFCKGEESGVALCNLQLANQRIRSRRRYVHRSSWQRTGT